MSFPSHNSLISCVYPHVVFRSSFRAIRFFVLGSSGLYIIRGRPWRSKQTSGLTFFFANRCSLNRLLVAKSDTEASEACSKHDLLSGLLNIEHNTKCVIISWTGFTRLSVYALRPEIQAVEKTAICEKKLVPSSVIVFQFIMYSWFH